MIYDSPVSHLCYFRSLIILLVTTFQDQRERMPSLKRKIESWLLIMRVDMLSLLYTHQVRPNSRNICPKNVDMARCSTLFESCHCTSRPKESGDVITSGRRTKLATTDEAQCFAIVRGFYCKLYLLTALCELL